MRRTPSVASLLAASAAAALAVPTGASRAGEVKTLDDIHIEGEVRLPRVLFITSRETVRPMDFLDLCMPPTEGEALPVGPVPVIGAPADAVPGVAAAESAAGTQSPAAAEDATTSSDPVTSEEESR